MKIIGWFLIGLGFAAIVIFVALLFFYKGSGESYSDKDKKKSFAGLVGVYQLDIERSELNVYLSDTVKLKELKLILKSDSTFVFTQKVAFLYDSLGVWSIDGYGENTWTTLRYNKFTYYQIESCCEDNKELSIYVTRAENALQIQFISFKKIK